MSPQIAAAIAVALLGIGARAIVDRATRTPDYTPAPYTTWGAVHAFLSGILVMIPVLGIAIGTYLTTGQTMPLWSLILLGDLLYIAGKAFRHAKRCRERDALTALYQQPTYKGPAS
ncbi:hypothetical protein [Streptomyces cinereoruber]|uniref:hypothetical protein n=1 Tax=Streptomyces cinereoruber TaxID=67260 RepID=UPI003636C706